MSWPLRGKYAIVAVAEAGVGLAEGRSPAGLMAEAAQRALVEAGLRKQDVDGLFSTSAYYYMPAMTLGEYLGIRPRHTDTVSLGGCSFVAMLGHACAAIEAGLCNVALIAYGSTQRSDKGKLVSMSEILPYEVPYGPIWPTSAYALIAQRHMAQYGTTSEQLAEVAVATRKWAMLTDNAFMREPITVEDVVRSPMISSPLHRLDCCLVTDGGGAVVVMAADRARRLPTRPVYVWGVAEGFTHRNISAMTDMTVSAAAQTGPRAFEMAGVGHGDVDFCEIYDSFTINVPIVLEDLGFCKKGEGGAFVSGQRTAPGGGFPVNTNGAGLSYTHPGMLGIFLVIEAVRQLRGEAGRRQVSDARVGLVHGIGGSLAAGATAILANDPG